LIFLENSILMGDGRGVSSHEDYFLSRQLSSGMIPEIKVLTWKALRCRRSSP
jgi:hypothetical protein